ncbi:uncharacterized protein FFB14_00076 [Fusarium fujikuroi]|nr:uncharacterized protein FFB14_00076 [Fusarium fujikuroi]
MAAAGQVAGTVAKIAISLIEKEQAEQAADERQNQIMRALNNIQGTLQTIQVQQEQLADIGMLHSSLQVIETWQDGYPTAVQNNDTEQIKSYIQAFNSKGAEGAAYNVQNIFNVLTGQDLADKNMTHEEIQNEVDQITSQFTANVNGVFDTAYEQFPAFVKKFKLSYQDQGSNLTNWFRMWRNNSHIKNYTPIAGGPHVLSPFNDFPNSLSLAQAYELYPAPCDDAEGIYPEVEFRFDETAHPLYGLATIYSRDGDLPLQAYNIEGRMGLTTTADPSYWGLGPDATGIINVTFNVLPVSTKYSKTDAPAFVLLLNKGANIDTQGWPWDIGSASPLEYWILRDDGTIQSPWVRTDGGPTLPPLQQPTAPGPNPVDDGQNQSQWTPDQFVQN